MANEGFSSDWIKELKEKNDLVSAVSRYIPLTRRGSNHWGSCPFHHEKTASFAVNERGGFYHCFGCGVSGDVISFTEEMENVGFLDAIKMLAERVGMTVPEHISKNTQGESTKAKRDRLFEATALVAKRYFENLKDDCGKAAREYLASRGINADLIVKFGIGYSKSFSDAIDLLKEKGFSDTEIVECGVGMRSENRLYDQMAGRFVVPVINEQGKVIAFGGRIIEKDASPAKYRNTSESFLFKKSQTLFGANLIKKLKISTGFSELILVEGYMDVISMHKVGIYNCVASMGTSFTAEQAKKLSFLTDKVITCCDGDNAGQKANKKNVDILNDADIKAYAATLPDGMDPDDFASKYGAEGFRKLFKNAMPRIDYKLWLIEKSVDLNSADGRASYVVEALDVLKGIKNEAEQEVYLESLQQKCRVSVETLKKQLAGETVILPETKNATAEIAPQNALLGSAEYALSSILSEKEFAKIGKLKREWLTNDVHQKIFDYLLECDAKGEKPVANMLFDVVGSSPEMLAVINSTIEFDEKRDVMKMARFFEDCLYNLKKSYANEQIAQLSAEFQTAEGEKRTDIGRQIIELQKLQKR